MTTPSEEHVHDGPVEVQVAWWLTVGIGMMLGLGLTWLITRDQTLSVEISATEQALEDLRIRRLIRHEIAQLVFASPDKKAESDEDTVL